MNLSSGWNHRWHAAMLIQQRDFTSMIFGRGVYIVLSLALLTAVLAFRNSLNFIDENGLFVASGAFTFPLFAAIFFSSLFLALSSVATIARERDQGTMEALFYGPVDSLSYVLGKYLAQISIYILMAIVYLASFFLYAALTNFTFSLSLLWVILLSILVASDFIAVGIFLSTLSGKVRTAIFLFLSVVLIFLVIEAGQEILLAIPVQGSGYYNPLLFLQNVLTFLNQIVDWLSPISYLNQGIEAIRRGSTASYFVTFAISLIYALIFLGLSVVTLDRKGVRK